MRKFAIEHFVLARRQVDIEDEVRRIASVAVRAAALAKTIALTNCPALGRNGLAGRRVPTGLEDCLYISLNLQDAGVAPGARAASDSGNALVRVASMRRRS